MLQIVEFFLLRLKLLLQNCDLFLCLKEIVRNIQLQQYALGLSRLLLKAVNLIIFDLFVVQVGGDSLHIFFALIPGQCKYLTPNNNLDICFG